MKAKFIERGVEVVAQLYTTEDEGLIIDVLRVEVSKTGTLH